MPSFTTTFHDVLSAFIYRRRKRSPPLPFPLQYSGLSPHKSPHLLGSCSRSVWPFWWSIIVSPTCGAVIGDGLEPVPIRCTERPLPRRHHPNRLCLSRSTALKLHAELTSRLLCTIATLWPLYRDGDRRSLRTVGCMFSSLLMSNDSIDIKCHPQK
jgi:hypothetical protein